MKNFNLTVLLGITAGLLFAGGLITATSVVVSYPDLKSQKIRKIKSLHNLAKLEQDFNTLERQLEPLKKLNYSKLPDAEKLIRSIFSAENIDRIEVRQADATPNFTITTVQLDLKNIEISRLPAFIRTMESLRPPLKLTACKITASHQPGIGRISLTLQRPELR